MARTSRLIDIHDVQLKTLRVEVAALTVSGKQMTLSTFRQLPERAIWCWDDDAHHAFGLAGLPWGRVLYFWAQQPHWNGEFHLVWQDADRLYRTFVTPKPAWDVLCDLATLPTPYGDFQKERTLQEIANNALSVRDERLAEISSLQQRLTEGCSYAQSEWERDHYARLPARLEGAQHALARHLHQIAWHEAVLAAWAVERDRRRQARDLANEGYQQAIARMLALPQLFIAL